MVIFIYRPELYNIKTIDFKKDKISTEGIAEIIVAKHRNGPTGSILLSFVKQFARFENPELVHTETPF
jgi:replicative DNA helicase